MTTQETQEAATPEGTGASKLGIVVGACTALLVIGVLGAALVWKQMNAAGPRGPIAVVEAVEGEMYLRAPKQDDQPLVEGLAVYRGQKIVGSGSRAAVRLLLPGGMSAELEGYSELSFEPTLVPEKKGDPFTEKLLVRWGKLSVDAKETVGTNWVFASEHVQITAKDAEFFFEVEPIHTRVDVQKGGVFLLNLTNKKSELLGEDSFALVGRSTAISEKVDFTKTAEE